APPRCKILVRKDADYSTPVWLADEAAAVACRLRGPAAGDAPAENRWTQHGAFETGTPVDVATGHACDLACGIEPSDRFEVLVDHAALKAGLDAAEVFARQREDLNRVIGRRVERLRRLERLAELRLRLKPLLAGLVVALHCGEDSRYIDFHSSSQLSDRVALTT